MVGMGLPYWCTKVVHQCIIERENIGNCVKKTCSKIGALLVHLALYGEFL